MQLVKSIYIYLENGFCLFIFFKLLHSPIRTSDRIINDFYFLCLFW